MHVEKMQMKRIRRMNQYNNQSTPSYIPANLGRNHPDYGMSAKDHQVEKIARGSEKNY